MKTALTGYKEKMETNDVDFSGLRGVVTYSPQWLSGDSIVAYDGEMAQSDYHKYDSLFSMFIEPEVDYTRDDTEEFNIDKQFAQLIDKRFNSEHDMAVVYGIMPGWTSIRDRAVQLTGAAIHNVDLFVRHLKDISSNTIYLDASTFHDKDPEVNSFGALMHIANSTKTIVEDYLAEHLISRATIDFINADAGDIIYFMGSHTSKWLAEGEILNKELIKIPAFQRNFNRVVITGVPKAVGKGHLNMNALYQLFAKLGRINTKILLLD